MKLNGMESRAVLPGRDFALDWARDHLAIQDCNRLISRPWAKTYRVDHPNGKAYLKIVSPVIGQVAITLADAMAERFPKTVPSTIATDVAKGLILSADHGGKELSRRPGEERRRRLLTTYAKVQCRCVDDEGLLDSLPVLDTHTLVDELIAFLTPDSKPTRLEGAVVSANYFLSSSRCRRYRKLLSRRADLLQAFINRSAELRPTLNHCDLRTANAAESTSGEITIYDWDESRVGPAGLSLHAMFSGCTTVLHAIDGTHTWIDPERMRQPRRELNAYLDKLVDGGYADEDALKRGIGPAAVAGMVYFIIGYSRFPKDSRRYRNTIRSVIKKRLSDLLDVCDYLCIQQNADVVKRAGELVRYGRAPSAERLLGAQLDARPGDTLARRHLGVLQRDRQRLSRSIRTFNKALVWEPDSAATHFELGVAHAREGDYAKSTQHLQRSLSLQQNDEVNTYLERVCELERWYRDADKTGTMPEVSFTDEERNVDQSVEKRQLCTVLFRKHGTLLMRNVFDPALLNTCHENFIERYRRYLGESRQKDALRIGDKRFQITMDLAPPYNSPDLYANRTIVSLMKQLVGPQCILGCFVSAMSLPGSEDQRLHKDHKDLFFEDPSVKSLPSFAVTVMVPLVDVDEIVGTTRMKKGSHKLDSEASKKLPYQTPFANVGDCYLMDYRLSHHGQANRSDRPRPILSLLYQRPWFRDYINFRKQATLNIEPAEYDKVPKEFKSLLSWTTEPGVR